VTDHPFFESGLRIESQTLAWSAYFDRRYGLSEVSAALTISPWDWARAAEMWSIASD
jgi:hypothetical protein